MFLPDLPTALQLIEHPILQKYKLRLYVKREDLIHPQISGNKWRKLKYNLEQANSKGKQQLLTFGGAYSNHIYAVAAAGKEFDLKTVGVIRGEETLPLNPTLNFAKDCGMELTYISREEYRNKNSASFLDSLKNKFGDFYLIPEGGSNPLAVKGCREIVDEINVDYNFLCCPVGTGATITGLIEACPAGSQVIGFSAIQDSEYLNEEVKKLLNFSGMIYRENWKISNYYCFGGYARFKPELIDFINSFKIKHHIQLDPVYTGKMMFGVFDLIDKGYFPENSTLIAIHTGGLQGIDGFNERYGGLIK